MLSIRGRSRVEGKKDNVHSSKPTRDHTRKSKDRRKRRKGVNNQAPPCCVHSNTEQSLGTNRGDKTRSSFKGGRMPRLHVKQANRDTLVNCDAAISRTACLEKAPGQRSTTQGFVTARSCTSLDCMAAAGHDIGDDSLLSHQKQMLAITLYGYNYVFIGQSEYASIIWTSSSALLV